MFRIAKLVVGKDVNLSVVNNGNDVAINGTKLNHIKQVYQDTDTTYINFEEEFSQLAATSKSLANKTKDDKTVVLDKLGSSYTLDLSKFEVKDNTIILNIDPEDLIDSSGDLIIKGLKKEQMLYSMLI